MSSEILLSDWAVVALVAATAAAGSFLSVWVRRRGDLARWALWFGLASWAVLIVAVAAHDELATLSAAGLVAGGAVAVLTTEAAGSLRHPTR